MPLSDPSAADSTTDRLTLSRPRAGDVDEIYAICSDPCLWRHYPSLRHRDRAQSEALVARWAAGWETNQLDTWIVREHGQAAILGYGGCSLLRGVAWNLGYRIAGFAQRRGIATELSRAAIDRAHVQRPELPVIAYLLEHNEASAHVARKVGLSLVHRAPDSGNPDPAAMRLVFADRPLNGEQLAAALR